MASLGDECILRSVIAGLGDSEGVECLIHSEEQCGWFDDQFNKTQCERAETAAAPKVQLSCRPGLLYVYARLFNKARHLRFPEPLRALAAFLYLPFHLLSTRENRSLLKGIAADIERCEACYFYGGSAWSAQFFWTNACPLFWHFALCRFYHKDVFCGPQQYGRQTLAQRWFFRFFIRPLFTDVRCRNARCVEEFGFAGHQLLFDEVFACTRLYPVKHRYQRARSFILINFRSTNFVRAITASEMKAFAAFLAALDQRLALPFKLFGMSDPAFCDDLQILSHLQNANGGRLNVEVARLKDEYDLIDLSEQAYGTISMSFHGCLFSMMGGCPAVPVTSGPYYDYKYADFDRYTGNQTVPILSLQHLDQVHAVESIVEYFERYDPSRTAEARVQAAAQIGSWYMQIRNDCGVEVYESGVYKLSEMRQ
ncbi:MAG TPA: hypothetical protein VL171_09805 [Verrucomicrobiae bacterium]|nr:hypothetical protein [Verrucomicrobiae bacterium]